MASFLSESERDRAKAAFEKSDADGSGAIDIWELRDTLRELGQEPTLEEVVEMVADVDEDGKGVIDFDGFCQLLGGQKVVLGKIKEDDSDTLDAFVALGGKEDKTGHVRVDKIRWFLDCFGLPIDADDLLREMNTDHSGLVDYEQFKAMMLPDTVEVPQDAQQQQGGSASQSNVNLSIHGSTRGARRTQAKGKPARASTAGSRGNAPSRHKVWPSIKARKERGESATPEAATAM